MCWNRVLYKILYSDALFLGYSLDVIGKVCHLCLHFFWNNTDGLYVDTTLVPSRRKYGNHHLTRELIGQPQLDNCNWTTAIGQLQLDNCNWTTAIGRLQLDDCNWTTAIGQLQLDDYNWTTAIGRLQLDDCNWTTAIGRLQLDDCNWTTAIGQLQLDNYNWATAIGQLQLDNCNWTTAIGQLQLDNCSSSDLFYRGTRILDRGSTVVKVLCYKSEGRWFDPSWCQ